MVSSFVVSIALLVLSKHGLVLSTYAALMLTVAITTICWVATAYLGPETDRATLMNFYKKVRPSGPGWAHIRAEAGVLGPRDKSNIPRALLGWVAGCTAIWSALFAEGNYLYGRTPQALGLAAVFVVSAIGVVYALDRSE